MKFVVCGHENVLCQHKNTLEFTKDSNLTKRGDCILGINSNFKLKDVKYLLKYPYLKIEFEGITIIGKTNKSFSSNHEIVLRKSNFTSERTLLTEVNVIASKIPRKIVKKFQSKTYKSEVLIEPLLPKALIFDVDNTLVQYTPAKIKSLDYVEKYLKSKQINVKNFKKDFLKIKLHLYFLTQDKYHHTNWIFHLQVV